MSQTLEDDEPTTFKSEIAGWDATLDDVHYESNDNFFPDSYRSHADADSGWGFESLRMSQLHTGPFDNSFVKAKGIPLGESQIGKDQLPRLAPGGYIEPNYHIISKTSADKLYPALGIVLEQTLNVDITSKNFLRYTYKCVYYRHGGRITFKVSIFSLQEPGKYAVEFQRRSGDVIHFSEAYHKAVARLAELDHVHGGMPVSAWPSFSELPDFPDEDAPTMQDYEETVSNLLSMAISACVDIKTQGLQALYQMTESAGLARAAVASSQQAWKTLEESLGSEDEDVHRCAVSALANLFADDRELSWSLEHIGVVAKIICLLTNSTVLEVVRRSALALANLGNKLKGNLLVALEFSHGGADFFKTEIKKARDKTQDTQTKSSFELLLPVIGL